MNPTITPTVGRRIHFWPNAEHAALLGVFDATQPCVAGVLYVWPDGRINIEATGPSGSKLAVQGVRIVSHGEDSLEDESYAEWMVYQTTKAAAEQGKATPEVGTVTYPDGVQATGTLPLPAESPAAAAPAPARKTAKPAKRA